MTKTWTDDELDAVYGTEAVKVGGMTVKLRVMLTRPQRKAIANRSDEYDAAMRDLQTVKADLDAIDPKSKDAQEKMLALVDRMEAVEDVGAAAMLSALRVLVSDPPEALEALDRVSLLFIFRQLRDRQNDLLMNCVERETGHPLAVSVVS